MSTANRMKLSPTPFNVKEVQKFSAELSWLNILTLMKESMLRVTTVF